MSKQEFKNDILVERQKTWGDPVKTHAAIAEVWTGLLKHRLKKGEKIKAHEVAACMDGMKSVRMVVNPAEPDSYVDKHGYTELAELIFNSTKGEY